MTDFEYEKRPESWGGAYVEMMQKERDDFARGVLDQLRAKGYTKEQILAAFERLERKESPFGCCPCGSGRAREECQHLVGGQPINPIKTCDKQTGEGS